MLTLLALAACLTCALGLLLSMLIAPKLGLVDTPDARKQHSGSVPLVGGIGIFISMFVLLPQIQYFDAAPVLILGFGLLTLGIFDDLFALPPSFRMVIQSLIALLMVYWGGQQIVSVGDLGFGPTVFGPFLSVVFTVLCTIGVINAINMIDGIDGLAGLIMTISFSALAILALVAGDTGSASVLLIVAACCVAFLVLNSRAMFVSAKVFLGDSGSMLLGFVFLWFCIHLTQGESVVMSPVTAGWIFGLPLADTISVMVGRIAAGKSPFVAGRDHFHHRLLDHGYSVNSVVLGMGFIHLLFVSVALGSEYFLASFDALLFWLFVALVIAHFFLTPRLLKNQS